MKGKMRFTTRQLELLADMAKTLSLGLISGSVVDAVLDGTRMVLDVLGFTLGLAFGVVAVWLTGKLNGTRMN